MGMEPYTAETARKMKVFHDSLSEKDKRRYAAVEADKLGHGGTEFIARLFGVDQKTIRKGLDDLDSTQDMQHPGIRKKGAADTQG